MVGETQLRSFCDRWRVAASEMMGIRVRRMNLGVLASEADKEVCQVPFSVQLTFNCLSFHPSKDNSTQILFPSLLTEFLEGFGLNVRDTQSRHFCQVFFEEAVPNVEPTQHHCGASCF